MGRYPAFDDLGRVLFGGEDKREKDKQPNRVSVVEAIREFVVRIGAHKHGAGSTSQLGNVHSDRSACLLIPASWCNKLQRRSGSL